MGTVNSIIAKKKTTLLSYVGPQDAVALALKKMSEHNLGAILVMEEGQIVGIFSERDYARKLLLKGRSSLSTPVDDVMNTEVLYVTPEYTYEECLALMIKNKIRHLPVIDNGNLLSLLTMEEVIEALIEDKEFHIAELTKYVTGSSLYKVEPVLPSSVRELVWKSPRPRAGQGSADKAGKPVTAMRA